MSDVRLIDANALTEYFERLARSLANARCFSAADAVRGAAEKVASAPIIDAVPVVRCRECKHSDPVTTPDGKVYCVAFDEYFPDDGFCHEGEKMDGGSE